MLSQESMEQLDKPDLIKKLTELQDYMTDIKLDGKWIQAPLLWTPID